MHAAHIRQGCTRAADIDAMLAPLTFARRTEDLGRLAALIYWDVRRWARAAQQERLAERSSQVITGHPHPSRAGFLRLADEVIAELECIRQQRHGCGAAQTQ